MTELKLNYYVTRVSDGRQLGVYNEHTSGRTVSYITGPFGSLEEAKADGDHFVASYGMVYFPRASAVVIEDKFYSRRERSTTSD